MDGVFKRADRAVGILSERAAAVAAAVVFVTVFMVTIYVIVRYGGGRWTFVEEWAGYLLVLMSFLGCAYALRQGAHVRVTVVSSRLPKKTRLWMTCFTSMLALVLLGFFVERSISWIIYQWETKAVSYFPTHTPMWIPSTFVTIGLVIFSIAMALYMVQSFVNAIRGIKEEEKEKGVVKEIL